MHMMVYHGNVGRELDLVDGGGLQWFIYKIFGLSRVNDTITFTEPCMDLNVHAVYHFKNIHCFQPFLAGVNAQYMLDYPSLVQTIKITASFTRFGTCIYRVAQHSQDNTEPHDFDYALKIEQLVAEICEFIHKKVYSMRM